MRNSCILIACWLGLLPALVQAEQTKSIDLPAHVRQAFTRYCADCHGPETSEADINLEKLAKLETSEQLELLNRVQDQLFFKTMPPSDSPQPSAEDRTPLVNWLRSELRKHNASKLDEKLRYPAYGNYVQHELLFDGSIQAATFSPARRWLVSPQIFAERVLDVFQLQGRERDNFRLQGFAGVTNPFVLPDQSGVRYYDHGTLDGGTLLVMLGNAQWIADKQLRAARVKNGELAADQFENVRDRWYPKTTPAALEAIVLKKDAPTDAELTAAIQSQFACVLQRAVTDDELQKYLALTREAIQLGGNTAGLRQMLVTVLLESEFLYRLEFGAGKPDEHGRVPLAPREASFAIAYALGDRGPDATLLQAASAGRLTTREDYRREVDRLLADQDYFRAPVDPGLNGNHIRSHVVSHPKLARFFREFFGYTGALKVFKDSPRSGGYYNNPDRGHTGTPGWLIQEADELVIWCLDHDQKVFENLLTTDQFFVYHNMDTKTGLACIAEWREVYEKLRDTPWKSAASRTSTCPACRSSVVISSLKYFSASLGVCCRSTSVIRSTWGLTHSWAVADRGPKIPGQCRSSCRAGCRGSIRKRCRGSANGNGCACGPAAESARRFRASQGADAFHLPASRQWPVSACAGPPHVLERAERQGAAKGCVRGRSRQARIAGLAGSAFGSQGKPDAVARTVGQDVYS